MKLHPEELARLAQPLTDEDLAKLAELIDGQGDATTGTVWVWSPSRGVMAWLNLQDGGVAGWQIARMESEARARAYADGLTALVAAQYLEAQGEAQGVLQSLISR
jgi:hypothetical protein